MRGPKPAVLALNEQEQEALEALVRKHNTPQQIAQRGRMILLAAEGKNNAQIARELGACGYGSYLADALAQLAETLAFGLLGA